MTLLFVRFFGPNNLAVNARTLRNYEQLRLRVKFFRADKIFEVRNWIGSEVHGIDLAFFCVCVDLLKFNTLEKNLLSSFCVLNVEQELVFYKGNRPPSTWREEREAFELIWGFDI